MINWDKEAKLLLKVELMRRGVSYKQLVEKLAEIDVAETEGSIANKVSRGKFSLVFFMQCMKAIGVETLNLAVHATK